MARTPTNATFNKSLANAAQALKRFDADAAQALAKHIPNQRAPEAGRSATEASPSKTEAKTKRAPKNLKPTQHGTQPETILGQSGP